MPAVPAIVARSLGKKYQLGATLGTSGLRHILEDIVCAPVRWLRRRNSGQPRECTEFWALQDVSFSVGQGEVVGVIGRNGAGKSTLLKLLSRITEPTVGAIGIRGRVASLLEVGTGFHPELTGRENIFLNGAVLGMSRAEIRKKFEEIVAFAEIEKFLETPVKRYSSGMYVRLAFAVAAHLDPDILVVDEVLAVGDAQFQRKCLGKMREVSSGGGRTVLFVSHAMHTVRALCQRGLVLAEGRLIFDGPVEDAISTYTNSPSQGALAVNRAAGVALLEATLECQGENALVTVHAVFELTKPVGDAGIGIHLETPSGLELCDLRPETSGLRFGDSIGRLHARFALGPFIGHLSAGTYRLQLSLHQTNWRRVLDPTPVGEFVVPAADIYSSGYPPKAEKDGPLVMPFRRLD